MIRELPDLKLEFFVRGCWEGEEEDKDRKISRNDKGPPTVLHADQEYTLCIKMIRLNQTR